MRSIVECYSILLINLRQSFCYKKTMFYLTLLGKSQIYFSLTLGVHAKLYPHRGTRVVALLGAVTSSSKMAAILDVTKFQNYWKVRKFQILFARVAK